MCTLVSLVNMWYKLVEGRRTSPERCGIDRMLWKLLYV